MAKILLIDDDEMTLIFMRKMLEDSGFPVVATADGPHGIELFKEHHPQLVLLDIGLPGMSGLQDLRELRSLDPEAQVVIISGYKSDVTVRQALDSGAQEFIEKPVDARILLEKVRRFLSDSSL
jgi:two-component system chemotaxis response regulator CheY